MRKSVFLWLIFLLFSIVACGKGELSRSKAISLLEKDGKDRKITYNILSGSFQNYSYNIYSNEYKFTEILKKQEYVNFTNTGYFKFNVILLPSIKPYIIKEEPRGGNSTVVTIDLGTKSIKEITGIRQGEEIALSGCKAIADVTYKFELTPIGKLLPDEISRGLDFKPTGQACFDKYDDGWRLKKKG